MLGCVSLFNDIASEMIYPLLPVFLASIGASMTFIGLIEGIAEATASVLKLFSGWIADKLGQKRLLMVLGYGFSNIVRPLMGVATSSWQVLGLRFSDRVGKGVRTAPKDALIADNTDVSSRGKAFGFTRSMDHAGAMLGALVAFILLKFMDLPISTIFLFSAIPGAIALVFVIAGVGVARDPGKRSESLPSLSLRPFDRRFKTFLVIMALFTLGNSADAFLLLKAKEIGVPLSELPLLWILFHAVKSATSGPGGALSDRVGRTKMIVSGWFVYALVYLGFSVASLTIHAWLLFAVYGLYFGLTEGVEKAFVADLVPADLRGTAFGIFNFTTGIVALPASLLCGYLWQEYSSMAALGAGAAMALVSAVLLALKFGRS